MGDRQLSESQVPEQVTALQSRLAELLAAQRRSLQQQERLLQEVLERVEREQCAIAHLLHDGLYQRLVAAKMQVEASCTNAGGKTESTPQSYAAVVQQLDAAIAEARQVIHRLEASWVDQARQRDVASS